MAKLKGPLFSLGASQQLGKALVYFPWKGLNVVREYVIPSNPKSTLQKAQRTLLTNAVKAVHDEQAVVADPFVIADSTAYALWAGVVQTATTWFNQAVRQHMDRYLLSPALKAFICRGGEFSAVTSTGFKFELYSSSFAGIPSCVDGNFKYGTSKTALVSTKHATVSVGNNKQMATWTGLAPSTKYYVQFDGLSHADYLGAKSGIYHVTTLAA